MNTPKDFQLIESFLWTPESEYFLLKEHLERLSGSAAFFGFDYSEMLVIKTLEATAITLNPESRYKIRLLLSEDGRVDTTSSVIENSITDKTTDKKSNKTTTPKIRMASSTVNSADIFLRHKTTNRKHYNDEIALCQKEGFYDAVFTNEKGEITECAHNNIVLEINGIKSTPHESGGLLKGTFRCTLLESGEVAEKILTPEDIYKAEKIYCCNSVRGMVEVQFTSD